MMGFQSDEEIMRAAYAVILRDSMPELDDAGMEQQIARVGNLPDTLRDILPPWDGAMKYGESHSCLMRQAINVVRKYPKA